MAQYIDENTPLANVAEDWCRKQSKVVPTRGTSDWQNMYEDWAEYAFGGCEICGGLHPGWYEGDCRNNATRRP